MATSHYKGQIPERPAGQTTCIHHRGRQLDFYCQLCVELICHKCITSIHFSHPISELSEHSSKKKQEIKTFIDKTENDDLAQITKYVTSTDNALKENVSNFKKLSRQLKNQTNKLKEDLDLLLAQTLSRYQQMEDENAMLLNTYKKDLNMYSEQLKRKVQECKSLLQRGTDIQIYDIDYYVPHPDKPTLDTPSFIPNRYPQRHLAQALGVMDTSNKGQSQTSPDCLHSVISHEAKGSYVQANTKSNVGKDSRPQQSAKKGSVSSRTYLLPQAKVLDEQDYDLYTYIPL